MMKVWVLTEARRIHARGVWGAACRAPVPIGLNMGILQKRTLYYYKYTPPSSQTDGCIFRFTTKGSFVTHRFWSGSLIDVIVCEWLRLLSLYYTNCTKQVSLVLCVFCLYTQDRVPQRVACRPSSKLSVGSGAHCWQRLKPTFRQLCPADCFFPATFMAVCECNTSDNSIVAREILFPTQCPSDIAYKI